MSKKKQATVNICQLKDGTSYVPANDIELAISSLGFPTHKIIRSILYNVKTYSYNEKFRKLKLGNKIMKQTVAKSKVAVALLCTVGFVMDKEGNFLFLPIRTDLSGLERMLIQLQLSYPAKEKDYEQRKKLKALKEQKKKEQK